MEKRCYSRMMLGQFWLSVRTSFVAVTKPSGDPPGTAKPDGKTARLQRERGNPVGVSRILYSAR